MKQLSQSNGHLLPCVTQWRELFPLTLLACVWPRVGLGEIAKLAESYSHYSGREVLCQMSCLNKFTVQSGGWPCLSEQCEERRNGCCWAGPATFHSSSSRSYINCILASYAVSSYISVMPISELNVWTVLIEQIKVQHNGNGSMLMVNEVVSAFSFFHSHEDKKHLQAFSFLK